MKVLLVDCLGWGSVGRVATVDVIGTGPSIVASILESYGISVDYSSPTGLPSSLHEYTGFMISGMVSDVKTIRCVISKLRKENPHAIIVLGGPISAAKDIVADLGVDFAIVGEAEYVLPKLIEYGLFSNDEGDVAERCCEEKLPNLIIVRDGSVVYSGPIRWCSIDEITRFSLSQNFISRYPGITWSRVYVEVLRGCSNFLRPRIQLPDGRECIECGLCRSPRLSDRLRCPVGIPPGCGYCSVPTLYGPARSKPVEYIVEEIRKLVSVGVQRVVLSASDILDYGRDWLVSPEPLTDPRKPMPNVEALEALFSSVFDLPEVRSRKCVVMIENIKANLVNEEVAKVLGKYFRGTSVHIGCETGSEEHAISIGRPCTPTEVLQAVKLLKRYGLRPYVYFIHGLPGQDLKIARRTAKLITKLGRVGVEKITVYRFQPLPATAFEKFPRAPPASKSMVGRIIVDASKFVNRFSKRKMIGKELEVVVASRWRDGIHYVTYPIYHGPVTLVKVNRELKPGTRLKVRIIKVLSDRVVLGTVIE
ncbi:MAG: B12-binding domain-containing radical SAM protein [Thermoprotei archaeon]|nr:MAG: B12-binding domain-containing radical SAM protein [Thermoprotei archaeon]